MSTTISSDHFRVLVADSIKTVERMVGHKLNNDGHNVVLSGLMKVLNARGITIAIHETPSNPDELPFPIRHMTVEEAGSIAEGHATRLRAKGYKGKLLDIEMAKALRADLVRIERSLSIDAERRANLHVVPAE